MSALLVRCVHCARECAQTDAFCDWCGSSLRSPQPAPPAAQSRSSWTPNKIGILLALVLMVAGTLALLASDPFDQRSNRETWSYSSSSGTTYTIAEDNDTSFVGGRPGPVDAIDRVSGGANPCRPLAMEAQF